jgi:hypothetical protein
MQHFTYKSIPSVKQFQSDSSIMFAVRGEDKILIHLDWLLERYHLHTRSGAAGLQRIILCEIFLGANYWIKSHHENRPHMKKERFPAVLALFEAAVRELCALLACNERMVARHIEEIFGRDLTPEGAKTDGKRKPQLFPENELALYRIRFKGGRAYHLGLNASLPMRLAPLHTEPFFSPIARKDTDGEVAPPNEGWGPFIMTLEREFYMTKHWFDTPGHRDVFHSSYTHGRTICAAGTMLAEHGVIKGIRPDSGHYKPLEHNTVGALLALQMFCVPMDKIEMQDYKGKTLGTAREFVSSRLTWEQFQAAAQGVRIKRALGPQALPSAAPQASAASGASGNTALLAMMGSPQPSGASGGRPAGYSQTPSPDGAKPAYSQTPSPGASTPTYTQTP